MVKEIAAFLLLMTTAAAGAAPDNGSAIANVGHRASRHVEERAVPPLVKEEFEYYDIRGDSEQELRSQMCRNGCRWRDGKIYDSVTNWHVTWDYDYDRTPGRCAAASFRTSVDITYRLPRWVRTGGAPRQLVNKWNRYLDRLMLHEKGHRDLAVRAAVELSGAVAALPPAPDCSEIDHEIRDLSRERLRKLKTESDAYDTTTLHGVTQGAVFP